MAKNNTFKINGKTVTAKPFDYNLMCDLDDMGVSMADISAKPSSFTRAYIALCMDVDKEEAGQQIQEHIIGGGTMESLVEAMNKEMADSDFFQALAKKTEKNNQ